MKREEEKSLDFWNGIYSNRRIKNREDIVTDQWLQEFDEWIGKCNKVLDLGCGNGNDTLFFLEKKKKVVACDQSEIAIENMMHIFPELEGAVCFHMPGEFPFHDEEFDLICADLSLHYFTKEDTFNILEELKRILVNHGYLLVRVNSINDFNHGAGEGEEMEHHLFKTKEGMLKRFFDKQDVEVFFSSFRFLFCEEQEMHRYSSLKKVYTICLQK